MQVTANALAILPLLGQGAVKVKEVRCHGPGPLHLRGSSRASTFVPSKLAGAMLVPTLAKYSELAVGDRDKVSFANWTNKLSASDEKRIVPRERDGAL
jgi:hypothetical protein